MVNVRSARVLLPMCLVVVLVSGFLSFAAGDRLSADGAGAATIFTRDGLAIGGYDPVAYFTDDRPVKGDARFEAQWGGATWRFASADHRERFLADPSSYAPAYGGYCAWAVAEKGERYSTVPDAWAVVDGRLYLNYSHAIQERWERDIPGFIAEGDRRWPQVATAP